MKKPVILFLLIFFNIITVLQAKIINGIACKVGGELITINEFYREYEKERQRAFILGLNVPEKLNVMNRMVNNLIIRMESEKKGIFVSNEELDKIIDKLVQQNALTLEQFEEELAKENISMEELRDLYEINLLRNRLLEQLYSLEAGEITEAEIEEFYEHPSNKSLFFKPAMVIISQIFIPVPEDSSYKEAVEVKNRAMEIYDQAMNGADFVELVGKFSMAPDKEENLGSIGSFTYEQLMTILTPEGADVVFSLNKGEVTSPMRFGDGYYLFRVDDKSEETQLSFEEARENIKEFLFRKNGEEFFRKWVSEKRESGRVQIMIDLE
jgi:peptidyl-prolyl cis-trans isomerase SurA